LCMVHIFCASNPFLQTWPDADLLTLSWRESLGIPFPARMEKELQPSARVQFRTPNHQETTLAQKL